ncbi:glycosyltransferase family 4 protein [Pedobacter nyackensis]|uniref:Glycosyltransferase involved in cell wall bisynthesis n=1 Tax=Pedobacter nyackensis TaxID=475255 RepID=A0A1W2C207_9SPHI|nr:glycosyltransferase family 4 protein [Pedobacter nyackensis]SMC79213.1 Glycosyltransferase involved in cell wall bisynthesis [Pedobacter nyackensis]
MKVLHVVNISFVIPYYLGAQIDYLQQRKIDIFIACTPSEHLFEYANEKGFIPLGVSILREISVLQDLKAVWTLRKLIKKERIDIVIGHTPKGALIGMLAGYLSGTKKRIYFRHGLVYETSKGLKRIVLKTIERFTGFLSTKVVCVSPSVLEISNREKLSNSLKNVILNKGTCNGLDAEGTFNRHLVSDTALKQLKTKYLLEDNDRVIGYVGRLVNDKGICELISAWQEICKEHNHVKLLLAGPFERRDSIDDATKKVIMEEPSIIHTGLISDVVTHYALMDIFILPSHREGFPTVVLEASAMELPVITTNVTGCRDAIVPGETGRFTNINPTAIAENVGYYLDNFEQAKLDGMNGRKFVISNFNQLGIWEKIERELIR